LNSKPCKGGPWLKIAWDWWIKGSKLLSDEKAEAAIVNGIIPLRFKPKIAVNHGITLKPNRLYLLAIKHLYERYDEVICVSSKLRKEVKEILNVDCRVIPLPVKLDLFKPMRYDERENIVVHIGTRPVKNPHISIEVIRILRRRGYDVKLVIVGPPTELPRVEGIEYRYSIPEKEKLKLLCRAKALVLPSSYEAFPYVTLEAMACGTPVVVSDAVPEEVVVSGFNGVRVGNYNPKDYANALETLLTDEELWLRLSRNGLEFVKQFDYIEVARKYLNIVREIS